MAAKAGEANVFEDVKPIPRGQDLIRRGLNGKDGGLHSMGDASLDKENYLTTGKFAEINNISRKTLRLWHDMGLLKPCMVNETNGYSYYSIEQCSTVDAIIHLQQCDLSLAQIKELLDNHFHGIRQELLNKRDEIDRQIIDMTISRQNTDKLLDSFKWWHNNPLFDTPIIEHLPAQRIISFPILYPPAAHMDYMMGDFLNNFEIDLRILKKKMADDNIPMTLFCYIGDHITKQNIIDKHYDIDKTIIFIDNNSSVVADHYANDTFPGGDYLTMYRRSIDIDGKNSEVLGIEELLEYAHQHHLQLNGDYYGQIIADTPIYHFSGRGMAVKLLLPVCAAQTDEADHYRQA